MKQLIGRFLRDSRGQDLIEYVLLAALISVFSIVMIQTVGTELDKSYVNMKNQTAAIP